MKKYYLKIIGFFALLSFGYYYFFYFIQDYTNKIGFPMDINLFKLFESILLVFIIFYFYKIYNINDSLYLTFTYVLAIFIFIPMAVFYWMTNESRSYVYMNFLSFLILNLVYMIFHKIYFNKGKNVKIKTKTNYYNYILLSIFFIFMILNIIIYWKFGNSLTYLFHMKDVYEIRMKSREVIPIKVSYIISWSINAVIPCFLAYCLKRKKYFLMIIPIILQILLFTIGGNKSYVFGLIFMLFIYILFKNRFMHSLITFLNFILAMSLFINNKFLMAIVIRRAFFVPASTSFAYYKFFSINPKMQLSNSIFSRFFENIYNLDSPFVISRYIYRVPKMSSNVNYIGNAYSNFGLLGIIIFTLILAIIFLAIEKISLYSKERSYLVLITFSAVFVLTNSALLTTLNTHGFLFAIIMCYIFSMADFSREKLYKERG